MSIPRINEASQPDANPTVLIAMNGSSASEVDTVGGGDVVLFKFIRLSNVQPDVLIPKRAQGFVVTKGRIFTTFSHRRLSLLRILALFFVRTLQGIWHALRNRRIYDVALAASFFGVDFIPVWFWKARHKGALVFHLIPPRKAVNLTTRIRFGLAATEQFIMLRVLRHACDFLVAGNDWTRRQLAERMPDKPIFVLPAGFDAAAIDRAPAQTKDPNLSCFVGRLVSQKGIFDLLKVMVDLSRTHPNFRLVMAGTGLEREFLAAEIQRLRLSNIHLAGFVSEDEKIALLKKSAFFFLPSYEEGWGIALAEALYCECRCICYELPHYRSIFSDFPAYAKLGDPDDFVRLFRQNRTVSPEQKNFLRQYDDPLVVRQLVEHLRAVVGEAKRA